MIQVGLISDTHGYLHPEIIKVLEGCDEIWHAGDIGTIDIVQQLQNLGKTLRVVYGNIDGQDIRLQVPHDLVWVVGGMKVFMTHIGGYPGKYVATVKRKLLEEKPDIYVCGHSHILKVIYDKDLNLLHINPGACGKEGFHRVKTMIRFAIDEGKVKDMAVIELGIRN